MSASPLAGRWLHGSDETQGIVSVDADAWGRARVWRRIAAERVELTEHRFPNWFLTNTLQLIEHLPARKLAREDLQAIRGGADSVGGLGVMDLEGGDEHAFRYLVLADRLADLEPAMLDACSKPMDQPVQSLADLPEMVTILPPVEQFLVLTGRTYHKGLEYGDLRRLQFDLETTGLDEQRDRIFMISLRDSTGWRACLDTAHMSEAALLEKFVRLVQERDPDVLENHNVFWFDLPFLVRRSIQLGVRLALGRDGSEPGLSADVLRLGDRWESFPRWLVAGREVIDTLHAVKRDGAAKGDLRRHGLKDAARYFGFAKADREYVPGAEIWNTFRSDPDRVRRYAGDDVEEVDGLSLRLMEKYFVMASLVPRTYQQIATDVTPRGVFGPLLRRVYFEEGRALPAPSSDEAVPGRPSYTRLFATGVVRSVTRFTLAGLAPWLVVEHGLSPRPDRLHAVPRLLEQLLQARTSAYLAAEGCEGSAHLAHAEALEDIAAAGARCLADPRSSFWDPRVAEELSRQHHIVVDRLIACLDQFGAVPVEVDGETLYVAVPDGWPPADEHALLMAMRATLPASVRLRRDGLFQAMYVPSERSHILLGLDGGVTLVGDAFRVGRRERYGEQFVRQAAPFVLAGNSEEVRRLFMDLVNRLRDFEVPVAEVSMLATLHKSPSEYARAGQEEEPYEILLAAGVRSWRAGQRVRHFRHRGGERRILVEGDGTSPSEVDVEHYVRRLYKVYCRQFARAYRREDFLQLFEVPDGPGLFDHEFAEALKSIYPVHDLLPRDVGREVPGGAARFEIAELNEVSERAAQAMPSQASAFHQPREGGHPAGASVGAGPHRA